MKKIISLLLCILILTTSLPLNAFANSVSETNESPSMKQDVQYEPTNSIGSVLLNAEDETVEQTDTDYIIDSLTVTDKTVTADVVYSGDFTLVVGIYDENSGKMLASGKTEVKTDARIRDEIDVEIDIDSMPEYYELKAFMLNSENKPLTESFTDMTHTKNYQDFMAKTTDDFDEESVIRLEDSNTDNFMVVSENAIIAQPTETENILTLNDFENGKYVIEKATDNVKNLKAGDVFYMPADNIDDCVIIKVKEVSEKDGTVTITADEELKTEDVFDFVKVNLEAAESSYDPSQLGSDVEYVGASQPKGRSSGEHEVLSKTHTFNIKKEAETSGLQLSASGTLTVTAVVTLIWHFEKETDYKYVALSTQADVKANLHIEAKFNKSFPLYGFAFDESIIKATLGLTLELEASAVLDVDVNIFGAKINVIYTKESGLRKVFLEPEITATPTNPEYKIDAESVISVNLVFGIEVEVDIGKKEDILKLNVTGKVYVGGKITLMYAEEKTNEKNPDSKHLCEIFCCNGKITVVAGLELVGTFLLFDEAFYDEDLSAPPFEKDILKFHFSDGKFNEGYCDNYAYKVELNVYDEDKKPLSGAVITYPDPLNGDAETTVTTDSSGIAVIYAKSGDTLIEGKYADSERELFGTQNVHVTDGPYGQGMMLYEKTFNVSVKVQNTNDGSVISGATVSCEEQSKATGADGVAYLSLKKGKHTITASTESQTVELIVVVDENNTNFVIGMEQMFDVTFCVINTNDYQPLSFVTVSCNNKKYITDNDGKVTMSLKKGQHTITAKIDDEVETLAVDVDENYRYFYIEMDVEYVKVPVTVTVVDEKGNLLKGIQVSAEDGKWKRTDENGVAVLNLNSNREYIIKAEEEDLYVDEEDLTNDAHLEGGAKVIVLKEPVETKITVKPWWTYENGVLTINTVGDMGNYVSATDRPWNNIASDVKEVHIGEFTTSIGGCAFAGLDSLEYVHLPDKLMSIDTYAFRFCKSLSQIKIPDTVTNIGEYAFGECQGLLEIKIPNTVTYIGDYAFYECDSLKSFELNSPNCYFGQGILCDCDSLEKVILLTRMTSLPDYTFYRCDSLKYVLLPNNLYHIGKNAFGFCFSLKSIYSGGTKEDWKKFSEDYNISIVYESTFEMFEEATSFNNDSKSLITLSETITPSSYTVSDAIIGNNYVFIAVKNKNAEDLLATDNLLYIDQMTATSETLTFNFELKEDVSDFGVIVTNADLTASVVSSGTDLTVNDSSVIVDNEQKRVSLNIKTTVDAFKVLVTSGNVKITDLNGQELSGSDFIGTGCKIITLDSSGNAVNEYICVVACDTDGNGKLTAADARITLRASAKLDVLESVYLLAADANADGKVNASDARAILRKSAGLE